MGQKVSRQSGARPGCAPAQPFRGTRVVSSEGTRGATGAIDRRSRGHAENRVSRGPAAVGRLNRGTPERRARAQRHQEKGSRGVYRASAAEPPQGLAGARHASKQRSTRRPALRAPRGNPGPSSKERAASGPARRGPRGASGETALAGRPPPPPARPRCTGRGAGQKRAWLRLGEQCGGARTQTSDTPKGRGARVGRRAPVAPRGGRAPVP